MHITIYSLTILSLFFAASHAIPIAAPNPIPQIASGDVVPVSSNPSGSSSGSSSPPDKPDGLVDGLDSNKVTAKPVAGQDLPGAGGEGAVEVEVEDPE